ncbi:MAG: NYN domain-containing protein [bacterium]
MLHNIEQLQKKFGKIFNFIDFGNVNKWFDKDNKNFDGTILKENEKLIVDINKLANFTKTFSKHARFYYGLDPENKGSIHIIAKARKHFNKTVAKPLQNIKHYLMGDEDSTRKINHDSKGKFIYIPKCNFDVEICIDAVRFINKYNTFCLFSSDADFVYLLNFLKKK